MLTRLCLALIGAFAFMTAIGSEAEARVHSGKSGGSASTSRSCLQSSVRAVLGRIEQKFGSVTLVSTCRPGATIRNTGKRSKHASGEAVDFVAPRGKKGEVVRWLIANHKSGGTMTYPMMNHIHIDVGYRFVSLAGKRVRA
jgi:hypothetical protein